MESAEALMSSFVDKRSAVSRSDLKVLPSGSLASWGAPQSMRKLSGVNVNVPEFECEWPLAETMCMRLVKNVNRKRRNRKEKGESCGGTCDDAPFVTLPIIYTMRLVSRRRLWQRWRRWSIDDHGKGIGSYDQECWRFSSDKGIVEEKLNVGFGGFLL